MDKDLKLHIEFDIIQLRALYNKLALYPLLQEQVLHLISSLTTTLTQYATQSNKTRTKTARSRARR